MTIPQDVISRVRRSEVEDLNQIVEEQLDEARRQVKISDQVYNFRPETRCRVCRNDDLRQRVEDMLATGTTYREILAVIRPANTRRAQRDQITYHSVRNHATNCFNPARASLLIHREILERRAAQRDRDFVKGVGHGVTLLAVLESIMVKGYAAITDERIPITPELAVSAATKLHELTAKDANAMQAAEMIAQVHRLTNAVYEVCSEEQIRAIQDALSATEPIEAEIVDDDDDDFDDEDTEFDPATDAEFDPERD